MPESESEPESKSDKRKVSIFSSPKLRKNSLNRANEDFDGNPFYPDYFDKKPEVIEGDKRNESGMELGYIIEQREHKPKIVSKINSGKYSILG